MPHNANGSEWEEFAPLISPEFSVARMFDQITGRIVRVYDSVTFEPNTVEAKAPRGYIYRIGQDSTIFVPDNPRRKADAEVARMIALNWERDEASSRTKSDMQRRSIMLLWVNRRIKFEECSCGCGSLGWFRTPVAGNGL